MNNVVGIDVSKGKSMVSVLRPFGEVVAKPFSIGHTGSELKELADYLKSLDGETRVVMEHTGRYYEPVARFLLRVLERDGLPRTDASYTHPLLSIPLWRDGFSCLPAM